MKDAAKLNLARVDFTKKRTEAMSKFQAIEKNFRDREKKIRADLEKAGRIWKKAGERFKWWGSLP